jgi:hypothetical protein
MLFVQLISFEIHTDIYILFTRDFYSKGWNGSLDGNLSLCCLFQVRGYSSKGILRTEGSFSVTYCWRFMITVTYSLKTVHTNIIILHLLHLNITNDVTNSTTWERDTFLGFISVFTVHLYITHLCNESKFLDFMLCFYYLTNEQVLFDNVNCLSLPSHYSHQADPCKCNIPCMCNKYIASVL